MKRLLFCIAYFFKLATGEFVFFRTERNPNEEIDETFFLSLA